VESGQRVVVGVTGSVGNLQAVRCAAAEARRRETSLVAVHA
jgi:K+-sensing histidine kinase KdpD